jgi:glutaredoxin
VPALEALQDRFTKAGFATFGVSVDSLHCHANWAVSLGGISLPLLSDFHPKGAVAASYGLYLERAGIDDRATVIIDAGGVVRHISSVTPAGSRDISAIAALCEEVAAAYQGEVAGLPTGPGLPPDATLYVKSNCGFSLRTLNARANLHLQDQVRVVNVTEDPAALSALERLAGKATAPCLVADGQAMHESEDIQRYFVERTTARGK